MKRFAMVPILAATSVALGQSFNVDLNATSGVGSGVPSAAFAGAAGQAGTWNAVGSSTSVALVGLNGAATSATLSRNGGGTIASNSTAALSGDDEKLLEDAFRGSSGVTVNYSFNNLTAGTYALYTYAIDPGSSQAAIVNVSGSTSRTDQVVGSFLASASYFVGATHALHVRSVNAGGTIAVSIAPTDSSADIAGFQLVKLNTPRLRIHVNDNAAGAGNGASWLDAFTSIQTALSTSRYSGGANTEVWVANGMYKPTTGTDRYASFDVPSNLHFYGGFSGTETSVDQRGTNLCYLNGDIGNTSVDSDNSYTVLVADLTAAGTIIDGFRVHNGYNSDSGTSDGGHGGGLRLQGGNATVRNCTFVNNYSSVSGGGVYVDFGQPTFIDCLFYNNEAFEGSALYHSDQFPIRMYNCEFISNSCAEGTVKFVDGDGVIVNGYFHGNYAAFDGAAVDAEGAAAQVELTNCTIAGNNAGHATGGVYARGGADVTIKNSILWLNRGTFPVPTSAMQYNSTGSGSTVTFVASTAEGLSGAPGSDPLFIDGDGPDNTWGTFDDNCRLQESSPAVNLAGNANLPADVADLDNDGNTAEQVPVDFDGLTRIRDVVIDKGAFEYQPECGLAGDLDGDGDVDLSDLSTLLSNFGDASGAGQEDGDTDGDSDVDLTDLAALLAMFGSSCP